ncbi:GcrA family cell cycle regulator [Phenylobacterium montanum]|uniref:GcrA cell cycle regulator n=1 Tax=Phenylobacterium montanum TaxID=2823693 RepID=A0A975G3L5_9CAUL|nr:GcrA family cell cycle regulator [Caulobacter sp. S6]QUD89381.1 GcrA cell cycle regulator [Caulobacter sp. S6]
MDWNEERTAQLTKMWLEGMSASQCARQLGGVSRNAVIGKVHRLGLDSRQAPSRPRSLGGRPAGSGRAAANVVQAHRSATTVPTITPAPRPAPVAPPVNLELKPTTNLLSLGGHACRWPIGDPGTSDFGFCGRPRDGVGSYCADHAQTSLRRKRSEAAVNAEVEYWLKQASDNRRRPDSIAVR